jgi:opacity protein-like surface antigen
MKSYCGLFCLILALFSWHPDRALAAGNPALYDWGGFYTGVFGGWIGNDRKLTLPGTNLTTLSVNSTAFQGGGEIGYNAMIGSSFLIGSLIDGNWSNLHDTKNSILVSHSIKNKIDLMSTARLKLGYSRGIWLLYLSGGYVAAREKMTDEEASIQPTAEHYDRGWVAGAGVEWKFAQSVSAKIDYSRFMLKPPPFIMDNGAVQIHEKPVLNLVRLGLDYHF